MRVDKRIQVNVPLQTVYNQWTQFEEFPRFMAGVKQVEQLADDRLHWKAEIGGETKEWFARVTRQVPDQVIAWQSEGGTRNSGEVLFRPLGEAQTEVELHMDFEPEDFLEQLGSLAGMPERRVEEDLGRFKEFIEARGNETGAWRGEIDNQGGVTAESAGVPQAGKASGATGPGSAGDLAPGLQPSGRSSADIGMTGRSDVSREGLGTTQPGGRGAIAYGGRGDAGMGDPATGGGLGGKGRSSEGGALGATGGRSGGLGGEGRGAEGIARGGGMSSDATGGPANAPAPDAPIEPQRGPISGAAEMRDVSLAGGAGGLGAEDALADSGIRDQGGVGRESQSTEGPENRGEEPNAGPAGDDRPTTREPN